MSDEKSVCVINKMEKKINKAGDAYEIKSLIIQGLTMKETKKNIQ